MRKRIRPYRFVTLCQQRSSFLQTCPQQVTVEVKASRIFHQNHIAGHQTKAGTVGNPYQGPAGYGALHTMAGDFKKTPFFERE